jgi:hypothetical protein
MAKRGLYSNIAAKRKRIAAGSGESMRKPGTKGFTPQQLVEAFNGNWHCCQNRQMCKRKK